MPTPILKTADNGIWYAYWSENRRSKRKSMGTTEHAVAETRFAQWLMLGGHKGEVSEEMKASLTVAELWEVYDTKHVQVATASPDTIDYAWKNLRPHFGHLMLSQIDEDVVDEYEEKRAEGEIGKPSKGSTVRRELGALRACFNWHVAPERGKKRLLELADVPVFTLPAEGDPRERWLTTEELRKMFAAAPKLHPSIDRMTRGERFLWLALETAQRKRAILDLTWDRVDFETRVIHFAVPGKKVTKKRRPSVPISDTLLVQLKRMHDERINDFVMDHGGEVWSAIQAIVVKAGLSPKQSRGTGERIKSTGISPHTLRHTAATHMARRGIELWAIAGVLGNTLQMVERVYAKHTKERMLAAVNSISGKVLEPAE